MSDVKGGGPATLRIPPPVPPSPPPPRSTPSTGTSTSPPTDTITLSGTDTSGAAVNTSFSVYDGAAYKSVDDLLAEIESAFGDVTASITADGKLRVVDNEIGDTDLSVVLTPSSGSLSFDQDNDLGAVETLRKRELQAGADAEITVDGVTVNPTSNTVDDVIEGVTLNLKEADAGTTVTLNVGRDDEALIEKIQGFVDAYNEVMDSISAQTSYDEDTGTTGGPLFGDSSLRTPSLHPFECLCSTRSRVCRITSPPSVS